MATAKVSSKGQITLPAEIRRKLDITADSRVEIEVRGKEIVLRRLLTLDELAGIFHDAVEGKKPIPWEVQRDMAEKACAEEAWGEEANRG